MIATRVPLSIRCRACWLVMGVCLARPWSFFAADGSVPSVGGIFFSAARADDWPEYRGPRRDGVSSESLALAAWPENSAPKVLWRAEVGKGHSAVSVSKGLAYTAGWDGARDTLYCFDARTGALRWKQSHPCRDIGQWSGPRATPTIAGGVVYMLGQWGRLTAHAAADGKELWAVQLAESYNPDVDYGFCWSPLARGDLLLLGAGRSGLAIRARDGAIAWGGDGRKGACASPVPFEHDGQPAAVVLHTVDSREAVEIVGVHAVSGQELWRAGPWKEQWGAACVDPIVRDGKVFITTAEQFKRGARFAFTGGQPRQEWSNNKLACYTGGCVLIGEHLYLVDPNGVLKCASWQTGEIRWAERDYNERGTLIAAGERLLAQTGAGGELAVVEADPNAHREIRRAKVFEGAGATFTAPAIAQGRVYCRSYAGEVVCLDLGGK